MDESERPPERIPPVGRLLARGAVGKCPACGRQASTKWWVTTTERCRRCGLEFERIEGHFIGSIGINTIVSFFILMVSLIIGLIVTFPDFPVRDLILWNVVVAIVVPILYLPISRTLWTAIDIGMRPLEPHEVDWAEVYASLGRTDQPPSTGDEAGKQTSEQ